MSGASAMSGTVWLRMSQGSIAASASRNRCIRRASPTPTMPPRSRPAEAVSSDDSPARITDCHTGGDPTAELTGSSARVSISARCGIARSVVRGRSWKPATSTPVAGPKNL